MFSHRNKKNINFRGKISLPRRNIFDTVDKKVSTKKKLRDAIQISNDPSGGFSGPEKEIAMRCVNMQAEEAALGQCLYTNLLHGKSEHPVRGTVLNTGDEARSQCRCICRASVTKGGPGGDLKWDGGQPTLQHLIRCDTGKQYFPHFSNNASSNRFHVLRYCMSSQMIQDPNARGGRQLEAI
jgi:hypothetical protein